MYVGPYGPTYRFGVLDFGTYTVIDTTSAADTLTAFTVTAKQPTITISGNVTKWNSRIYDSGPGVNGAKVYLRSSDNRILQSNAPDAVSAPIVFLPVVDSAVTGISGAFSFPGHPAGLYVVTASATGYQTYSSPGTTIVKDTALNVILLPLSASSSLNGTVSGYGSCHYINNIPYCTGVLIPVAGCSVTVTFSSVVAVPLAGPVEAFMPVTLTATTDANGLYSFPSIPVTYGNQPLTVTASKSTYNKKSAVLSLITSPSAKQDFNLEISYTNSNTIEKNGMRYAVATNKADYAITDSVFTRFTVENISTTPQTFTFSSGCHYDMNIVKPPKDTLYRYLRGRACITMITEITISPNETLTMDFPGWKSDSAYDSLRVSAMFAGLTSTVSSIDIHFEHPTTSIKADRRSPAYPLNKAMIGWDRQSSVVYLSVASPQSVRLELYGLDGKKLNVMLNGALCNPGTYRFSLHDFIATNKCVIIKLKTDNQETVMPITALR
jgi:hypothetical protein